jgi:hypothetical protein
VFGIALEGAWVAVVVDAPQTEGYGGAVGARPPGGPAAPGPEAGAEADPGDARRAGRKLVREAVGRTFVAFRWLQRTLARFGVIEVPGHGSHEHLLRHGYGRRTRETTSYDFRRGPIHINAVIHCIERLGIAYADFAESVRRH